MLLTQALFADESGLETVEYAIIAGLIVVVVLALITSIGAKVRNTFQAMSDGI